MRAESASPSPPPRAARSSPSPSPSPSPPPFSSSSSSSVSCVGISLGCSFFCVGVSKVDGSVDVLANEQGNRCTPSMIAFTAVDCLIGEAAHHQQATNLQNTFHDFLPLLSHQFADKQVQTVRGKVDYTIDSNAAGEAVVLVQPHSEQGLPRVVTIDEFLVLLLSHCKFLSSRSTPSSSVNCVIAVPSFFNNKQCEAVRKAVSTAGLNLLTIIQQSIAASIALGLDQPPTTPDTPPSSRYILVVDVGGTTTTITILQITQGIFQIKSVFRDVHLGGVDLDARLVESLCVEFSRLSDDLDVRVNHRSLTRLTVAAEKAKRALSSSTHAAIECDSLYQGIDLYTDITRARLESLCQPEFKRIIAHIHNTLKEAELMPTQIQQVLMIGGTCRIPKLIELIRAIFKHIPAAPTVPVNPDESIAIGATIEAYHRTDKQVTWQQQQEHLQALTDTQTDTQTQAQTHPAWRNSINLQLSIGIEGEDGLMQRVFDAGSSLPASRSLSVVVPPSSRGESLLFTLLEGEHMLAADNHRLGVCRLKTEEASKQVILQIKINKDRQLTVSRESEVLLVLDATRLPSLTEDELEIVRTRNDRDELYEQLVESRTALMIYLDSLSSSLLDENDDIITSAVTQVREWLQSKDGKITTDAQTDRFMEKISELEQMINRHKKEATDVHADNHAGEEPDVDLDIADLD